MAFEIKTLTEKRKTLIANSRALLEKAEGEGRAMNAEEDTQWNTMNAEITQLKNRIDRIHQLEQQEAAMNTIVDHGLGQGGSAVGLGGIPGGDDPNIVKNVDAAWNTIINGWCRAEKDVRYKKSFKNRLSQAQKVLPQVNIQNRRLRMRLEIANYQALRQQILRNAAMSTTAAAGGYTIPQGFVAALEEAMLYFGPMLQVADIMRTPTGNVLPWPTTNDTANTGVLLSEATTIGSSVAATFSQVLFNAYKFSSQPIIISEELLNDSAFDLSGLLGRTCGTRLGRAGNTYLTTGLGSGSNQPKGIVTAASAGLTFASASAIAYDEVITLEHAVGLAYRQRMSYMCNDATVLALRKLKDSQGRYLWMDGANAGQPDKLNARPLYINPDMAGIATTNKSLIAGDFSYFKVRMVGEIRSRRLSERYADLDQEAFIAFMRMDSNILDAGTHPIVYAVHP